MSNQDQARLTAVLEATGQTHGEACATASEWVESRFDLRDALGFVLKGVLRPSETDGAPRFRDSQHGTPEKAASRKPKGSQ